MTAVSAVVKNGAAVKSEGAGVTENLREILETFGVKGAVGLNVPHLDLQLPIPALGGLAGEVVGGGNVGLGADGQLLNELGARIGLPHLTAVEEDVGVGVQLLGDQSQAQAVGVHGLDGKGGRAQGDFPLAAVGEDVQGIYLRTVFQGLGQAVKSVFPGGNQDDIHAGIAGDFLQQTMVFDPRVNDGHLPSGIGVVRGGGGLGPIVRGHGKDIGTQNGRSLGGHGPQGAVVEHPGFQGGEEIGPRRRGGDRCDGTPQDLTDELAQTGQGPLRPGGDDMALGGGGINIVCFVHGFLGGRP